MLKFSNQFTLLSLNVDFYIITTICYQNITFNFFYFISSYISYHETLIPQSREFEFLSFRHCLEDLDSSSKQDSQTKFGIQFEILPWILYLCSFNYVEMKHRNKFIFFFLLLFILNKNCF